MQSIRCTNTKSLDPWEETLCNPEYNYLAIFPDDRKVQGIVCFVRFFFDYHGVAHFESVNEISLDYYYRKTRIVHKKNPIAETLLKAVSEYYACAGSKFRIAEKMMRR